MAANENTKFQVNFKTNNGTLINLYATDVKELETGLTDLAMVSTLIKSTDAELNGGRAAAPAPTVESVAQSFNATPVAAPAVVEGQAPSCKHGVMSFRTGTSARGPWKGWMCAAPKGATDKCSTIWAQLMREPHEFEVPLCAQVGGDLFFPDQENEGKLVRINIAAAKSICRKCQHITECAEWGIRKEQHGIWGGLTGHERRQIRKQRNIRLEEDKSA